MATSSWLVRRTWTRTKSVATASSGGQACRITETWSPQANATLAHSIIPAAAALMSQVSREDLPLSAWSREISIMAVAPRSEIRADRKSTRLNSSHGYISYAVFCLKKKKTDPTHITNANFSQPPTHAPQLNIPSSNYAHLQALLCTLRC